MLVSRVLNKCPHFPGFVYGLARFSDDGESILIPIRLRKGTRAKCSGCRVDCKQCGIVVEEVPWGQGKHSLTKVYMHFLGHWARKLSWKETAESFRTTWDRSERLAWMRFSTLKATSI